MPVVAERRGAVGRGAAGRDSRYGLPTGATRERAVTGFSASRRASRSGWRAATACCWSGSPTSSTRWRAVRRRSPRAAASGGFTYHKDHDAWHVPAGPVAVAAVVRPGQPRDALPRHAAICNACPVKDTCTTSSSGREVQRAVDSGRPRRRPASTAGSPASWSSSGSSGRSATALTGPGAPARCWCWPWRRSLALLLSVPLWSHLRRTPVFVPEGMAHQLARRHRRSSATLAAAAMRTPALRATAPTDVDPEGGGR